MTRPQRNLRIAHRAWIAGSTILILETFSRAYSGKYDISEFPAAYKDANQIIDSIEKFNLTSVVDKIEPFGSIMAGHSGYVRRN